MNFNRFILESPRRLALPISMYPGLALTRAKVSDIVTRPEAQAEAQAALRQRYGSPFVLTAMDLSVEAEAFGCTIAVSDSEVPTVIGRLVTSLEQAERLAVPHPGDGRTGVYLAAARLLRRMPGEPFVLAGCIGPFSLAARLVGVSEALELTIAEPELMHVLLRKSTEFLIQYIRAFRNAGAQGVIMAEPAAGLLSPRGQAVFSSAYIRRVADAVGDSDFTIVLHNCAAKLVHLPAILETGLKAFHFGAPMDVVGLLGRVGPDVVVCGNLDPANVFVHLPPAEVAERVAQLLTATVAHRNFVLSSGCDLPPNVPLACLDAFYAALESADSTRDRSSVPTSVARHSYDLTGAHSCCD